MLAQLSLKHTRALLDYYNDNRHTIGPDGYKMQLSPVRERYALEERHAGNSRSVYYNQDQTPVTTTPTNVDCDNRGTDNWRLSRPHAEEIAAVSRVERQGNRLQKNERELASTR